MLKKCIAFILCIAIISNVLCQIVFAADTEYVDANQEAIVSSHKNETLTKEYISLDTITTVDIEDEGEAVNLYFIPEEDGHYTFYSMSDCDTYGHIYGDDEYDTSAKWDDDSGSEYNFSITHKMRAGASYELSCSFYDSDNMTGSYQVCITKTSIPAERVSHDGFVYINYGTYCDVIRYTGAEKNISIPSEFDSVPVIGIGDGYFESPVFGSEINSVKIPEGVTSIGNYAFSGCGSLKSIQLPSSLKEIGDHAFAQCYTLESIIIPEGVTKLRQGTFRMCNSLKSVSLPRSIVSIKGSNFVDRSLVYISYAGSRLQWKKISIEGVNSKLSTTEVIYGSAPSVEEFKENVGSVNLGPYQLKGATIDIVGYEIPLIDLEASLSIEIADNIKVIVDKEKNIKFLIGFDETSTANINGANNSTTYWSESYQEVKAMYQSLTGNQVNNTRLWNKYSALRGKLKEFSASMVVDVNASIAGYLEFKPLNGDYVFSDGGIVASFDAASSLRSYYGPCYVTLGVDVGVDGSLTFVNNDGNIIPSVFMSPELSISAGGGIGTNSTYAEVLGYGTLKAKIDTNSTIPFSAGVDLGVRWAGFIIGKEIFAGSKSFASMELYPNFGDTWVTANMALTPKIDASDIDSYTNLINSASAPDRSYLYAPYSLRRSVEFSNASFVKSNSYPLSEPNLVKFNDDTMLLVWIDDNGEKSDENMCTLMYSYFDGSIWSEPTAIHEDGTANDMPYVYSDGQTAYIVWQKANEAFASGIETSEMLKSFDLYVTTFDKATQTVSEKICINSEDDTTFEFNPVIYGEDGNFKVAWIENADNNIYQMSGTNSIYVATYDKTTGVLSETQVLETTNMFTDIAVDDLTVVYSVIESESNNLYSYGSDTELIAENINSFDLCDGKLFYSAKDGFYSYAGTEITSYDGIGAFDSFEVEDNGNMFALFTTEINEDFTKTLYYSTLSSEEGADWTAFEVYSDVGRDIRNYSPVVLSDNAVHVAFNYIERDEEAGTQTATIVVDQCTDEVDFLVEYVSFEDSQLNDGSVDLLFGIKNNCSTVMDTFTMNILDDQGNVVDTQTLSGELSAFGETEFIHTFTIPEGYAGEVYSFEILPSSYNELDSSDNIAMTTFECIHMLTEEWVIDKVATAESKGVMSHHCEHCNEIFDETEYFYGEELELIDTTGAVLIEDGCLFGLSEQLSVSSVVSLFLTPDVIAISKNGTDLSETSYVGTGNIIYSYDMDGNLLDSAEVILLGDTSGDGKITTADYMKVRKAITNPDLLTDVYFAAADINGDGKLSAADYMKIKTHITGKYNIYA